MGRRHWSRARSLVSLLLAMALGCASLQPSLGATCRGSDGRFTTCPSSGSGVSDEVLIGLGVAAGVALIGTVVYAVARSGSADAGVAATQPEPPGAITPPAPLNITPGSP